MIVVTIENLKLRYKNQNLSIKKSAIKFELYIQIMGIDKSLFYIIFELIHGTLIVIIINRDLCLSWKYEG